MGEQAITLEEAKRNADLIESERVENLNKYQSQLFALRKQEADTRHAESIDRLRKSTDAMTNISAILNEMQRRKFQFPAGEVENAIKDDAERMKLIADTRAGKFLTEAGRRAR